MPALIAQGAEAHQRWRRPLPLGQAVVVGRTGGHWAVPWDGHISRRHLSLRWTGERLEVHVVAGVRNPAFYRGSQQDDFHLLPGEHFVIGQTTFTLADQRATITTEAPEPVQQRAYSTQTLREVRFRNPDHRIEVLSRLPEVISDAGADAELFVRLVNMILAGVPRADAVAVVTVEPETPMEPDAAFPGGEGGSAENARPPSVGVLHWDQRLVLSRDFSPSRGLILDSIAQQQSVLHVWRGAGEVGPKAFTESDVFDWAFCTPVPGNACGGWGFYVAGRFKADTPGGVGSSDPTDLREDVKFTELVAAMLGSLRQMRLLERRHASLSQFFSPVVLDTLADEDPDVVLAPRETEVSVLFCDLRGFSIETERHAGDLLGLLHRVSRTLGVMTHHIRQQGGVVGDFQGDAAMGFWGWPLPQDDAVERTCRAALAVRAQFEATAGFRAGMGIATGRAVAGKIGTVDQVKVSVFGPVVNLASRLEGMTKILQAAILLDETTARTVRRQVAPEIARVRRLAVVRPFGMDRALEVSELLPPESDLPSLTDTHLARYELALDAFLAGEWGDAFALLHEIPAADRVKDFLTVYIAQHNRTPPPEFDGIIPLESK